ncbi:MAG: hypothetical protein K2O28_01440 [Clostridia bacterium]|nr:hypothetical protein [Clostridia bacterium]
MFKVILKTALKTLLIVAVIVLVAFGVASLGFPSEMAGLCEKSGNYSMATGYASLSYTYTKDVNDLNRCFLNSVHANNDSDIVKFGDKLIADEKFAEVCEKAESTVQIEADYKQYVYGRVAAAKYRNGKKDEAFDTAVAADVQGFPKNNALAILAVQVIESKDKDMANKLLAEVGNHTPAEGDSDYHTALVNELTKVSGQE